jgi:hypothetical protein
MEEHMRTAKKAAFWLAIVGLLCAGAVRLRGTHDDAFTEEGLLTANAADLKETIVTPHLETPVAQGQSVVWCGSFQLAWNEACALVGQDLRFADEPAWVLPLNKKTFTKADIDAESYVAVAGFVKDDVFGQIARKLRETFHGQATPHYIPPARLTPRPQDIVAYAYLFKNLEFPIPFERIAQPVTFATAQVPCFGVDEEYKAGHAAMLKQLAILQYQNADDFVVELKTKSQRDRVILAKMQPEATLAATVEAVQKRVANQQPVQPQYGDVLKVPKLNFDITRRFSELEGKPLLYTNPKVANDLQVVTALQNIRYQFDEKGVRLRSESHLAFGCSKSPSAPRPEHVMVFDKPFLILLQNTEANVPYFACWVGSPELLVKAGK